MGEERGPWRGGTPSPAVAGEPCCRWGRREDRGVAELPHQRSPESHVADGGGERTVGWRNSLPPTFGRGAAFHRPSASTTPSASPKGRWEGVPPPHGPARRGSSEAST